MALYSSSAIFFYTVVPKDNAADPTKTTVIKSEAVCDLIFLQNILKFHADIIIGHDGWDIDGADEVLDVNLVCRNMNFHSDGKVIFDEIMKKFGVRLGFYWGMNMTIKMYRKYYQQYYDAYYDKLSKKDKLDPPKAMYYNAFTKMVNEYINIEKRHGNITLTPQK